MEPNFVCHICRNQNPTVFALTSSGKVPLCNKDVSDFLCSQGKDSPIILPLAAIAFVEKASEIHFFEERKEHMDRCEILAEDWSTTEKEEFETELLMLQTMKLDALAIIELEFGAGIQKLKNLHENFQERFATARREIIAATSTKIAKFGPIAELIVAAVDQKTTVPVFFNGSVRDILKQLEKAAQSSLVLATQDADKFFQVLILKNGGKSAAKANKPDPKNGKRPA